MRLLRRYSRSELADAMLRAGDGPPGGLPLASFAFRGNNAVAFTRRSSGELVLYGPAGSGKTMANLALVRWYCETYPRARCLLARKTRTSLTESAMVTFERDVLGPYHPALARPLERSHRGRYRFPNGSAVTLGGMDNPEKILSTDYDLIYVPECTELTLADWEQLSGRLRTGSGPFDLMLGDCNPTTPAHWVYKRATDGLLTLLPTTHKDNPRWWDAATGDWTAEGRRYVLDRLSRMTGARRKRFLDGVWAAAEGLVYDGYDPAVHLLPAGWTPPAHWRRVWSIDWGFRDPLVILFWAVDDAGRMYLYREFYRSNVRVEAVAKWCAELLTSGTEPRPSQVVADHDPEASATFTAHAGVYCQPADKSDRDRGLQETQGRFDLRPDGRPGIFFRPDARCHPADAALEGEGRPTSLLEELVGYVWKPASPERPKDEPIEINDHGCDAMRYACRACATLPGGHSGLYAGEAATPADY